MSTALKTDKKHVPAEFKDAASYRVGIVYAEWNEEVVSRLEQGATEVLLKAGILEKNLKKILVPGSYELTSGAQMLFETGLYDAVICLGCVIQGETRHFDFICDAVANGLCNIGIKYKRPVIFGVLTTLNQEQALERAGGKYGNKGEEAAETALKMIALSKTLYSAPKAAA